MPLMAVRPLETKLVLDESMPQFGTKEELTAYLEELEPTVLSLADIASRPTEQFGVPPEDNDEFPDAHMQYPRAWIQNFSRLLQADASWQWELGRADAAEKRITANLHLSRWLLEQKQDSWSPTTGVGILTLQCRHIEIFLPMGLGRNSPRTLSRICARRLRVLMPPIRAICSRAGRPKQRQTPGGFGRSCLEPMLADGLQSIWKRTACIGVYPRNSSRITRNWRQTCPRSTSHIPKKKPLLMSGRLRLSS